MGEHAVIVHQNAGDDFPWLSIECTFGDDPDRPCLMINCDSCEYASRECLTEQHYDAHAEPGCGIQEWLKDYDLEGLVIDGMEARVPVASVRFDDGWHLEVAS